MLVDLKYRACFLCTILFLLPQNSQFLYPFLCYFPPTFPLLENPHIRNGVSVLQHYTDDIFLKMALCVKPRIPQPRKKGKTVCLTIDRLDPTSTPIFFPFSTFFEQIARASRWFPLNKACPLVMCHSDGHCVQSFHSIRCTMITVQPRTSTSPNHHVFNEPRHR